MPFPDISPEIFSIELFGVTLALRWYALAYIAGLVFAWRFVVWMVRRPSLWPNNTAPMTDKQPEDLLTWMIVGVVVGGRLGFVFFYQPAYYLSNPVEIAYVWEGGMSFHGGFLGVIVGVWLYCLRLGLPVLSVGDAVAASAPMGILLGRLANFINGELWGRPTEVPWGVLFPDPRAQTCPDWWTEAVCTRHPSQLYEAALEGAVLFAVMAWLIWRRGGLKVPGLMIGIFFLGYGAARAFVEGFRQGDPQFTGPDNPWGHVIRLGETATSFGLTMGQVLSLPMVAIGVLIIAATWRRHATA
ncbi:MAG: prolipoprotein diacylglyceryl transferase [Pseudomonadota bacterium]